MLGGGGGGGGGPCALWRDVFWCRGASSSSISTTSKAAHVPREPHHVVTSARDVTAAATVTPAAAAAGQAGSAGQKKRKLWNIVNKKSEFNQGNKVSFRPYFDDALTYKLFTLWWNLFFQPVSCECLIILVPDQNTRDVTMLSFFCVCIILLIASNTL